MDFHKRKAKHDLWNNNGGSTVKQFRYKGGARESEKQLIRKEIQDLRRDPDAEFCITLDREMNESLDCYYYGPCARCLAREQDEARSQDESKFPIEVP